MSDSGCSDRRSRRDAPTRRRRCARAAPTRPFRRRPRRRPDRCGTCRSRNPARPRRDRQPRERDRQHRIGGQHRVDRDGILLCKLRSNRRPSRARRVRARRNVAERRATTSRASRRRRFRDALRARRTAASERCARRRYRCWRCSDVDVVRADSAAARRRSASSRRDVFGVKAGCESTRQNASPQRRLAELARVQARADARSRCGRDTATRTRARIAIRRTVMRVDACRDRQYPRAEGPPSRIEAQTGAVFE